MITGLIAALASIAVPPVPLMLPEFTIAAVPAKVTPPSMWMPVLAVIAPELLMPPPKVETEAT